MNSLKTAETIGLLTGTVVACLGLSEIVEIRIGDIKSKIEANTRMLEIPQHNSHGN